MSCFTRYEVFHQTENLVAVTTGDVAREEIKSDLLGTEEIGKTVVKEFVQDRLIKKDFNFHDSVKQQKLKTFETLYSHSAPFSTQVCKWGLAINAGGGTLRWTNIHPGGNKNTLRRFMLLKPEIAPT